LCAALLCSSAALAQPRSYDIPAEDAGRSIPELARQAGIQIIAPGQALHGLVTPAIKGQFEVHDALAAMLSGSKLSVASDDGHTIVLAVAATTTPDNAAPAVQIEPIEQIVVTGSRIISDASRSPTPVMVFLVEQLLANTPSNIPDALNKLPIFQGSDGPRNQSNAGSNGAGNVLNLRNFGAQRTLILLDGHRVQATTAAGTVDIDTLPQMLMTRVDVVTSGASAVYGSDAITGVVNFIIDKNFDGVKYNANAGISDYGDAASYQVGVAAGTSLFGGRGHLEGSLQYYQSDGLLMSQRPLGALAYGAYGTGTPANPFGNIANGRLSISSFGGAIACTACSVNGQQFVGNDVIGPFIHGVVPAPGSQIEGGGDGSYVSKASLIANLKHAELFSRFSYKVNDNTSYWVQGTATESTNLSHFFNSQIDLGRGTATYFKNNPFLPAVTQAQLGDNGTYTAGNTFTSQKWLNNQVGRGTGATVRNLNVSTGLDGTLLGRYNWDAYYTHGESRSGINGINNGNNQLHTAQNDVVPNPGGTGIACYNDTPAAIAMYGNLYPGCVPINPFGPTSITTDAYNYSVGTTKFALTSIMDNAGGGITGEIFQLPAGPVRVALSGEARWIDYTVNSNASPTQLVDCTGLRLCNSKASYWDNNTVASVHASGNVWEFAAEANIPVIKDMPLVQSFDVNVAGRYTDYSVSGPVQTWKVGLDWHLNDDIRFRGTTSIDIRAPTLNDLFSPLQSSSTGYFDLLTNSAGPGTQLNSSGNPNLVPEVARTYTVGIVLTPTLIPGLTASADFYHINLKNAIGSIQASNTQVQMLCNQSGGTSQYCRLYQRPFGFTNTTPANYPTAIQNLNLNSAFASTEGEDYEINYHFNLADLDEALPGGVSLRALLNVAPTIDTVAFPNASVTQTNNPKGHASLFAGYTLGDWRLNTQFHWFSGFSRVNIFTTPPQTYLQPRIASFTTFDVDIDKTFKIDDSTMDLYFTVQNAFNATPPVAAGSSGNPGLAYPGPPSEDVIGRYFTIGIRGKF
jgi:iron complex outermembrane receptor protein